MGLEGERAGFGEERGLKGWGWRREGGVGGSERVGFGEERGLKGWGRRLEKRGWGWRKRGV